jgi:hypothetical protein
MKTPTARPRTGFSETQKQSDTQENKPPSAARQQQDLSYGLSRRQVSLVDGVLEEEIIEEMAGNRARNRAPKVYSPGPPSAARQQKDLTESAAQGEDGAGDAFSRDLAAAIVAGDQNLYCKIVENEIFKKKSTQNRPTKVYSPSSIKQRHRRTKAEIEGIREAIYQILEAGQPMTVRQVFYALTVRHIIEKTEAEYNGTVVRLLVEMRHDKIIPYGWISDNTRWVRRPNTHTGVAQAILETAHFYRRSLWADAKYHVEIWCEKEALAGVLHEETEVWDVPLLVSRGFSSSGYIYDQAQFIKETGKPAFVYQFGDYDPSGIWIAKQIERGLREHAPGVDLRFERVAVTPLQIGEWNLPSRPTKASDSRAKNFGPISVELDAIPPLTLRALVRECIEQHVDKEQLNVLEIAEESEREYLHNLAAAVKQAGIK